MIPGGPPKVAGADDVTTQLEPAHAAATPTDGRDEPTPPTRDESPREDQSAVTRLDTSRPLSSGSLQEPQQFGDYEVLSEVARGGMGVVYRARQRKLGRTVALKMILGGRLANEDDVKRFHTEATAAANLSHPNIVSVYEVGEIEGQHFFSMEFIDGASLAQKLAAGPLPGKVAARYALTIARAVQHAHRHNILHRDLKPSNIMLDTDDEPHVTDFGLAKRLGDSGQTRSGAVLGTPSYMAPEQAAGRTRDLCPATDVYGIGAVLYELLTGRPPFRSESPMDTLIQVLETEPVPPRLLNPKVDHDLETICLKCLEKDPARRYVSAEELAGDLQRYLNGDAITARSFNVLDRLARTLDHSHHDVAFSTWSTMILIIAAIVFCGHVLVFALIQTGQSRQLILLGKMAQFAAIGYLFWQKRTSSLLPTTLAERLVWTIWIGYIAAYGVSLAVSRFLVSNEIITRHPNAPHGWEQLMLYPFSAVISGLAFFIMGSNYWGRFYAFGVGFFFLALLMPLYIELAPLAFGVMWSFVLLATGRHLRHVGMQAKEDQSIVMTSQESLGREQQG
jgi:serine/threonine protein kinase